MVLCSFAVIDVTDVQMKLKIVKKRKKNVDKIKKRTFVHV